MDECEGHPDQVEYNVWVGSENGVSIGTIGNGLATLNLIKNDTLAAGQDMIEQAKGEFEMGEQVASVCNGLGTAATLAKGLAEGAEIVSKLSAKTRIGVGIPRRQTATKKAQDLGPEVASLTQGLATKLKLGSDENEVVVTDLSNVNGMIGSPEIINFK